MFSKFFNLDKEKQNRIVNAAMKEFAQKGYDRASTNEIVKEAGISKGLLFHYFQNKKQLYLFLYDYFMEVLTEEIYKKIDLSDSDFFVRIHRVSMVKMDVLKEYPELFKFIEIAYMEESREVKAELDKRKKEFTDINVNRIYEGIDVTKFKEEMDITKALKIITWTFEKLGEEAMYKAKLSPNHEMDYDAVFKESEEYIEMLKTCFYK
ncbi:TetR/AcrR family transcriptional regulator [Bacillus sp. MRMR6]|uniref:TetR/AcrR family transcriptional regulator n=1 Tax=Bacillus sp. MRMR6 TaxID=1928617 RepID=UPI000951F4FF|nr:TetR/AcrR family transcriptional regulator [Bacillus sp. MRMR6]OLS41287.1 TetR family transcriptional regulator [Bacillus sp. MRMR6]